VIAERGLKATRQRDLIVDIFFSSTGHLSVDELLSKVQDGTRTSARHRLPDDEILADSGLASPRPSRTARPATRRPSAPSSRSPHLHSCTPSRVRERAHRGAAGPRCPAARVPRHAPQARAVRPLQGVPRRAVEALNTVPKRRWGFLARGRRACTVARCDPGSSCSRRPSSRRPRGAAFWTRAAFRTCAGSRATLRARKRPTRRCARRTRASRAAWNGFGPGRIAGAGEAAREKSVSPRRRGAVQIRVGRTAARRTASRKVASLPRPPLYGSPVCGDRCAVGERTTSSTRTSCSTTECALQFKEKQVIIPIYVVEEIDKFKRDLSELGRNAGRSPAPRLLPHRRRLPHRERRPRGRGTLRVLHHKDLPRTQNWRCRYGPRSRARARPPARTS